MTDGTFSREQYERMRERADAYQRAAFELQQKLDKHEATPGGVTVMGLMQLHERNQALDGELAATKVHLDLAREQLARHKTEETSALTSLVGLDVTAAYNSGYSDGAESQQSAVRELEHELAERVRNQEVLAGALEDLRTKPAPLTPTGEALREQAEHDRRDRDRFIFANAELALVTTQLQCQLADVRAWMSEYGDDCAPSREMWAALDTILKREGEARAPNSAQRTVAAAFETAEQRVLGHLEGWAAALHALADCELCDPESAKQARRSIDKIRTEGVPEMLTEAQWLALRPEADPKVLRAAYLSGRDHGFSFGRTTALTEVQDWYTEHLEEMHPCAADLLRAILNMRGGPDLPKPTPHAHAVVAALAEALIDKPDLSHVGAEIHEKWKREP